MLDFVIEDVATEAERGSYEKLPDGEYLVVISDVDMAYLTPKLGLEGLQLSYTILTGHYEGNTQNEFFSYEPEKSKLLMSKISQIAVAIGMTGTLRSADLPKFEGKKMVITLDTKEAKNGKSYQNVTKYKPVNGQPVAQQTATTPAAAQADASAKATTTPPWAQKRG